MVGAVAAGRVATAVCAPGVGRVEEVATAAERYEVVESESEWVASAVELGVDVVAAQPAGEAEDALCGDEAAVGAPVADSGHGRHLLYALGTVHSMGSRPSTS